MVNAEQPVVDTVMHPMRARPVTVSAVEPITARYVRVTVTGDDLADFTSLDADDHMKLAFPVAGQDRPTLPVWSERGVAWPEGQPRPHLRDYTPRRIDTTARALEIDFVLHGDGPAATWAAAAAPGQHLGVLGPRGSRVVRQPFAWYLMLGDETMLPSIARRLEEMTPGTPAVAIVEVDGPDDEQHIDTRAEVDLVWVHRNGAAAGTTDRLERALRDQPFPDGACFVWVGGEAVSLRPIRRHLLHERAMPKAHMHISGHWKRGVADHDHHEPVED